MLTEFLKLLPKGMELKTLNIEAINPLVYISGLQEYRKLGEKIGDAYKIGSKLFHK